MIQMTRASTSGPKLLPPIPSRTTSRMPRFCAEVAKVRNSSVRSFMYSMMVSQPRRLAMSVGSCFQSRWSRAHSRSTAWDAESRAFAAATRD